MFDFEKQGDNMPPFGFDPHQVEQDLKNYVEVNRIDVAVKMMHKKTGEIIPLTITFDNGREIVIDKVLQKRQGHTLKAFAPGWMYYCQTGKRKYYLHYDNEKWYIERKNSY